jgi:plastocyanin
MRPLPRPVLCLLPAALVLALILCWPVLAGPPGGYEVVIIKPDGTQRSPLLPEGKSDLVGEYEIRQPNGSIAKVDATGKTMFIGYGAREVEARDYFEINTSGLRIKQVAEAQMSVSLKASRTKIDPGQSVTFTATARPRGTYRYDWTLEPRVFEKDAGSTVTHQFDKEGTFRVVVGVYTSDDDRDSEPGTVTIQVGDPKQSDKDRDGGGDNTAAGAPSSGTSTGSSGAGSYDGSPTYAPSTPAPSTPTPPPTTPNTPPSPDIGLTTGTPVTGNLLADASDPPPSNILESAAKAARDGNPSEDSDAGADVPEAALSIAGVLALLALGAGIENRQGRRRPLTRRFSSAAPRSRAERAPPRGWGPPLIYTAAPALPPVGKSILPVP